jgi:hypothetical protein
MYAKTYAKINITQGECRVTDSRDGSILWATMGKS